MSGSDAERTHNDVLELLPWYANGTLPELERRRVEAHVARCSPCADELTHCRDIAEAAAWEAMSSRTVDAPGDDAASPAIDEASHGRGLQRVLARIDASEADEGMPLVAPPRANGWTRTPRAARWVLAAQAAAIAGLAWIALSPVAPPASFETLTSPTPAAERLAQAQLVFADGATEQDVRALLLRARAEIVGGPSERGVYVIALAPAAPDGPLAEERLATLRADRRVRFAQMFERAVAP